MVLDLGLGAGGCLLSWFRTTLVEDAGGYIVSSFDVPVRSRSGVFVKSKDDEKILAGLS